MTRLRSWLHSTLIKYKQPVGAALCTEPVHAISEIRDDCFPVNEANLQTIHVLPPFGVGRYYVYVLDGTEPRKEISIDYLSQV